MRRNFDVEKGMVRMSSTDIYQEYELWRAAWKLSFILQRIGLFPYALFWCAK